MFSFIFLSFFISFFFLFISFFLSFMFFKDQEKVSSFECGFFSIYDTRISFSIHFFFLLCCF